MLSFASLVFVGDVFMPIKGIVRGDYSVIIVKKGVFLWGEWCIFPVRVW